MNQRLQCLLATVESDSHFWNLIYLEKLLEEYGAVVHNLGSCTPASLVVEKVAELQPDLLVVSSINGHGYYGARELQVRVQRAGLVVPSVIGGRLTTAAADNDWVRRDLLAQGFTEVFLDDDAVERFRGFLDFGRRVGFSRWRPDAPGDGTVPALTFSLGR